MIELDAGHVGLFFVLAVSVATNVVGIWMLRHNLPELHKMVDDLREDFHKLDKTKLTRPEIQTMGPKPGHWPKVDEHSMDAAGYGTKGTGT